MRRDSATPKFAHVNKACHTAIGKLHIALRTWTMYLNKCPKKLLALTSSFKNNTVTMQKFYKKPLRKTHSKLVYLNERNLHLKHKRF